MFDNTQLPLALIMEEILEWEKKEDKEAESNMVSVRDRKDREEFKNPVTAEDFILYAADEIKERRL